MSFYQDLSERMLAESGAGQEVVELADAIFNWLCTSEEPTTATTGGIAFEWSEMDPDSLYYSVLSGAIHLSKPYRR